MGHSTHTQQKVGWGGYLVLFITITLLSGMFVKDTEWRRVFDFTVLSSALGQINAAGDMVASFRGIGEMGAKDGLLLALELTLSVILSLGIISATGGLGGLRAARQLMTPVLRPLLGIPGICSLVLITNLQNTDVAVGMTKEMAEEGITTEQGRAIFACWQTSGSACIANHFSSGAVLFMTVTAPMIAPLVVVLTFKLVGVNLLCIWIA